MEPGESTAGMAEDEPSPVGDMETTGAWMGGVASMGEDRTEEGRDKDCREALGLLRDRSTGSAWGWLQSLASSSSGGSVLMSLSSTGGSMELSSSSDEELILSSALLWAEPAA